MHERRELKQAELPHDKSRFPAVRRALTFPARLFSKFKQEREIRRREDREYMEVEAELYRAARDRAKTDGVETREKQVIILSRQGVMPGERRRNTVHLRTVEGEISIRIVTGGGLVSVSGYNTTDHGPVRFYYNPDQIENRSIEQMRTLTGVIASPDRSHVIGKNQYEAGLPAPVKKT